MAIIFQKPHALTDAVLHYCPGCPHGIIHRLVAEAIDNLGIEGRTIGVAPVGCAVMAYDYFNCDMLEVHRYPGDILWPLQGAEHLADLNRPAEGSGVGGERYASLLPSGRV